MATQPQSQSAHSPLYPRGGSARARSRGGFGKYRRAQGRERGRPAVFRERSLLEDEQPDELSEEEVAELKARYAKRTLSTNADRYEEPEPEIGSDGTAINQTVLPIYFIPPTGQPIVDPEVDLSAFLARQRLEDQSKPLFSLATTDKDDDVDPSLAHINPNSAHKLPSRKGKVQHIEWDASLEEMEHNKNIAQARSGKEYKMSLNTTCS